jgi:hypothetical protein
MLRQNEIYKLDRCTLGHQYCTCAQILKWEMCFDKLLDNLETYYVQQRFVYRRIGKTAQG